MHEASRRSKYSGGDSSILRVLVEKLSGMTFEQYLHDDLFVPAGANNPTASAIALTNANCHPDLVTSDIQPLYYNAGCADSLNWPASNWETMKTGVSRFVAAAGSKLRSASLIFLRVR